MTHYERTQHALWMWVLLLAIAAVIGWAWSTDPGVHMLVPAALPIGILVVAGALFTRLTIRVDSTAVRWYFGWGWPGGAIPLSAIDRAEVTRTNLVEGFGIHWTIWHGWLWNASGFQAVEIFKTDGGRVTLGTDDPQGLAAAIERSGKRASA